MFDLGGNLQELLLIFVVALLVVGPKRLPEVGRMLARAMRELRRANNEFRSTIENNLHLDEPTEAPARPEPVPSEPAVAAAAAPSVVVRPATTTDMGGGLGLEPYLAQRGSRLFHSRECRWTARIALVDRVAFERADEAKAQGFVDCPECAGRRPMTRESDGAFGAERTMRS